MGVYVVLVDVTWYSLKVTDAYVVGAVTTALLRFCPIVKLGEAGLLHSATTVVVLQVLLDSVLPVACAVTLILAPEVSTGLTGTV